MITKTVDESGNQFWFDENMSLHREDGPAAIFANGDQEWFLNDQRHREDGPAYIGDNGKQEWWIRDKEHRIDGPAVIYGDGQCEWWIRGVEITDDVELWRKEHKALPDYTKWTKKQKLWFMLRFGGN